MTGPARTIPRVPLVRCAVGACGAPADVLVALPPPIGRRDVPLCREHADQLAAEAAAGTTSLTRLRGAIEEIGGC